MAKSNVQRVQEALAALKEGLFPFVRRELKQHYGDRWLNPVTRHLRDHKIENMQTDGTGWDVQALVSIMLSEWTDVFGDVLGSTERTLIHEAQEIRNEWAHQGQFNTEDAYRALDTIERLLKAVSAEQASGIQQSKQSLLRDRYRERARREAQQVDEAAVEDSPQGGLPPWREIVEPHHDVATGRIREAEFAADLQQVLEGEATSEYGDPVEFYQRTYLTDGLFDLLKTAVERVTHRGGDPVVQLQTNFGGGKTHSLLALYHLFSDVEPGELRGLSNVLDTIHATARDLPEVNRAVLVGNKIPPDQPSVKEDGTEVNTLWGELAWQLGGREAYEIVRRSDESATNPGDALGTLFEEFGPVAILIDEWVAYARQLHDDPDLLAGSFDTHFTFAQTLTEEVKRTDRSLLVVSIPSSDNEIGGERGQRALDRLKNVVGRVDSPWQPARAEEAFEIVRRRLFKDIEDDDRHRRKDAVCRKFAEFYRQNANEFPSECKEKSYQERLKNAYPIHPELFDRLYEDWSSIDRFQRTRGVLRFLASAIHILWDRNDKSLMIGPSVVPLDAIYSELTHRFLEENWEPIINQDVDGPKSLPKRLDEEHPNLGQYSAARRVARTIYLGSAPTKDASNPGIDEKRIRLGCVQPGERTAPFNDALRRLTDEAVYLYVDESRYWYDTQPTVAKLARDRAQQYRGSDKVDREIEDRLRADVRDQGEFASVHVAPQSGADVADEQMARLVVLPPDAEHVGGDETSPAMEAAADILDSRGTGDRRHKNMLVFSVPDRSRASDFRDAVRKYLAWQSIVDETESLDLAPSQQRQAETKVEEAEETVESRLRETYCWLFVPEKEAGEADLDWATKRLRKHAPIAERASDRMVDDELLVTTMAGVILRHHLDRIPLWPDDREHIRLETLWAYFTRYLYLPRLRDEDVLLEAIEDGIAQMGWAKDTFAYADAWDADEGRYRGLKAGQAGQVRLDSNSVLVQPERAEAQIEADQEDVDVSTGDEESEPDTITVGGGTDGGSTLGEISSDVEDDESSYERFFGTVDLDPLEAETEFARIVDEVLQHLRAVRDADVTVSVDIEVDFEGDGPDEETVRTVSENTDALDFRQGEFEDD